MHPNEDYELALTGDLKGIKIGVPQDFYRENLEPEMAAPGFQQSGITYVEALHAKDQFLKEYMHLCFGDCDALHIPVARAHMPTIAATTSGDLDNVLQSISQLTYTNRAINYLGLPAMSVPAGFSTRKMPLAFQLVGKPFEESIILKIPDAYQCDMAWHHACPAIRPTLLS